MIEATNECERLMLEMKNVIIVGDFDSPHIDWNRCTYESNCQPKEKVLLDFCIVNGLCQIVSGVTRPASNNTLDLVFTAAGHPVLPEVIVNPSPVECDLLSLLITFDTLRNDPLPLIG